MVRDRGCSALGFALEPSEAAELSRVGEQIRVAARDQLPCVHPEKPGIAGVSIVEIAEPWRGVGAVSKNAVVIAPGRLDRSATGTGLCARMAALHARGLLAVGDVMSHASVIGTTFEGRIVSETSLGGRAAIVPAIRGSAWITGVTQLWLDPSDPFPEGYVLSDTWPGQTFRTEWAEPRRRRPALGKRASPRWPDAACELGPCSPETRKRRGSGTSQSGPCTPPGRASHVPSREGLPGSAV